MPPSELVQSNSSAALDLTPMGGGRSDMLPSENSISLIPSADLELSVLNSGVLVLLTSLSGISIPDTSPLTEPIFSTTGVRPLPPHRISGQTEEYVLYNSDISALRRLSPLREVGESGSRGRGGRGQGGEAAESVLVLREV